MKSITPINIILFIAVVILYVLHFTSQKSSDTEENGKIYYVNIDTLSEKISFIKEKQKELEQKEIAADKELREKTMALEKEITAYQRKAQGGYMTPKQMQAEEQKLGAKQQILMAERDSIASVLMMESQSINDKFMTKLRKEIDGFNKLTNAKLILAYSEQSNILHADTNMDITNTIVEKMNTED